MEQTINRSVQFAIIICTYNRCDDLYRCLHSIGNQTYKGYRIIIVDASDNRAIEDLANAAKTGEADINLITYVRSVKGLTKQRNSGIECLGERDDIALFIDDDVELSTTYLQRISEEYRYDVDERIVGLGGNAENEKKRKLIDRLIRKTFFITDNTTGKILCSGDAGHIFSPPNDVDVQVLSGCNMSYRTTLFRSQGLRFDENLSGYAYMEDQDFSMRAGRFGILRQLKEAKLVHHVSPVSRNNYSVIFEMYIVNSYYLLNKNIQQSILLWVCYSWRIVGKLLHACILSLKMKTSDPLKGWLKGVHAIFNTRQRRL